MYDVDYSVDHVFSGFVLVVDGDGDGDVVRREVFEFDCCRLVVTGSKGSSGPRG